MSEARPEKHDGRRHDSQDGGVLPNLSRFSFKTNVTKDFQGYNGKIATPGVGDKLARFLGGMLA